DQFTTTGGPWRPGNEFRLLADGGEFFARMLQAIDAASRYVLLEMYLVRSGAVATRFIEAFARCARRGVRVCLVLDAFGALGFTRADRRRLLDAGVELRLFNPLRLRNRLANLLRDHRKLLLTDGSVAFVGGAGLTDDFAPGAPRGAWRALMVEIEGPVISDWQGAFARGAGREVVRETCAAHERHAAVDEQELAIVGQQARSDGRRVGHVW